MVHYNVDDNWSDLMKKVKNGKPGDTISYLTPNQTGVQEYKIVLDKKGKNAKVLIKDYDNDGNSYSYSSSDSPPSGRSSISSVGSTDSIGTQ